MRVLLVATDFPPTRGGIQTLLREFCLRTRFEVRVIAPADPGWEALDESLPFTVRRVRSLRGSSRRAYAPSLALATMREARSFKPDVIFAGHVLAAGGAVLSRRRIPFVAGTYGVELVAPRGKRVARAVLPRANGVFAVSRFTRDAAVALGARDVEVIPVGAPEPRTASREQIAELKKRFGIAGRMLLTVARLEPHKGVDVIAKALPKLPADVTYVVVGAGGARAMFEQVARDHGVADRVVFAGSLGDDDLATAFSAADAFALLSRSLDDGKGGVEGCPVSLLEASAYGLPIVAGRTGGIADAIAHERTGLLANPEDGGEVADALLRVLETPEGERLGAAAAQLAATERSWASVVARIDALLERVARS